MNIDLDSHKNVKILDCTIRHGGYLNNWDFEKTLKEDYKSSISVGF